MPIGDVSTVAKFCVASAVLTTAMCLYAPVIGRMTKLIDRPDGVRKLHRAATPLIGGPALLVPSLIAAVIYLVATSGSTEILAAVGGAGLALVIGVIDDRMTISPVSRLAALTGVILVVFAVVPSYVLHSLWFTFINDGFWIPLGLAAVPVTAFVLLGFINAVNMADGINGQLLGSVIIWCSFITYFLGPVTAMPFVAMACSAAVTFIFNMRGRLFSGSGGAYASGLFIGIGTIFTYHRLNSALPADVIALWFWLPVVDCVRLMAFRALQGQSPFSADRNHFHHILLRHIHSRYALAVYLALLAAPGAAAIADRTLGSIVFAGCLLCYAGFVIPRTRVLDALRWLGAAPSDHSGLSPVRVVGATSANDGVETERAEFGKAP